MSGTSTNFFAVLGDDEAPNVGTGAVHLRNQPKTAESTSSKKSDSDPRADPSKARKKAPGPPSNDRVLRENKQAGRGNNRRVEVREGASQHTSRRHDRTDRVARQPRQNSEKARRADLDNEGEDEIAGEQIAREDLEATSDSESAEGASAEPSMTLSEYLEARKEAAASLNLRQPSQTALDAAARAQSEKEEAESRC